MLSKFLHCVARIQWPELKSGNHVISGALLIAALGSSGVFSPLIDLLKTWLTRYSLRSVTLELDGDKLGVSGISSQEAVPGRQPR